MSEKKIQLIGMDRNELTEMAVSFGMPAFRGKQLADWIYMKRVFDVEQMINLPKEMRTQLQERTQIGSVTKELQKSSNDGVEKLLIKLHDDQIIESVLLPYPERVSCCLSTQIGCPMGCTFCATAQGGFTRNLTAGEIVEQLIQLQMISERRISHLVYMGMGEPLLNLDNVVKSVHIFHEEMGMSMRQLTISTVGIVPKIRELAELRLPFNLAISLHAADDNIRAKLMPVNNRWPLSELFSACRDYIELTGRKMTFEYLLLSEINDTMQQAEKLAGWLKGIQCVVNLIPFNYVETPQGFKRPSGERIKAFREALERKGLEVSQRMERGHDIEGACGQLRGKHEGRLRRKNLIATASGGL